MAGKKGTMSNKKSDKVFLRHPGEDGDVDRTDYVDGLNKAMAKEDAEWGPRTGKTDRMSSLRKQQAKQFVSDQASIQNDMLRSPKYGYEPKNTSTKAVMAYDKIGASNPPNGPKKSYK